MRYAADYRLEDYILGTDFAALPASVAERAVGCAVDLFGALLTGSRSRQFEAGLRMAGTVFGAGDIAVPGTPRRLSLVGAAAAMGHASNAFDIDDGHNVIRAHPGTSFIGGLLAAAYDRDATYGELLGTLVACYDVTVRMGEAIMAYYDFAHSSGTFGAVGTAAGAGRLLGLDRQALNNALSVAEFNAPLVPGIRSVEYPSMNKDGVPFGVMTGMLAVMETRAGFTGNMNLLESDDYRALLDDLGTRYAIEELYFKPYACCRWAHPAIDACRWLRETYAFAPSDVRAVTVRTFERATRLSGVVPRTEDEAQYNLTYPVAAALVHGDFGVERAMERNLDDTEVVAMMGRIRTEADAELTALFPARRACVVRVRLSDGREVVSPRFEPRGEAGEGIGLGWLCDKFRRVAASVMTPEGVREMLARLTGGAEQRVRTLADTANRPEFWR